MVCYRAELVDKLQVYIHGTLNANHNESIRHFTHFFTFITQNNDDVKNVYINTRENKKQNKRKHLATIRDG